MVSEKMPMLKLLIHVTFDMGQNNNNKEPLENKYKGKN